ncbi:MAG: ATP-binding protein [Ruminococcaceae bacterium]|nr:ATP-binding protein [Oscillospiraceae bacterium]
MKNAVVRIERIEIQNFKNVRQGSLTFSNPRKPYAASILGLYGQNGSGKTALINALSLLKFALSGKSVPASMADYVHVDAEYATLKYSFKITDVSTGVSYSAVYELHLRRDWNDEQHNTELPADEKEQIRATIFGEVLSYTCLCDNSKLKIIPIIDTGKGAIFGPEPKLNALTGGNKETVTDLLVTKKLTALTSRSFIFSRELLTAVRNNCTDPHHLFMLNSLVDFGNLELFVIGTTTAGMISMDALPLTFRYEGEHAATLGNITIPLNGTATVTQEAYEVVKTVIADMNIVLEKIVPGLTIGQKHLGTQLLKNGATGVRFQLLSNKNGKAISLQYESEGIKKMISIMHLLIAVYNRPSVTVAIDELDSGVFEYLLGELLRIISEKGKGQLIFTSHNLRPLETLDRGFIAFTTTNPDNRYIRLCNVKNNHNLRDFYYRDIVLGEQSEEIYDPTNNYEIAFAFREAGDFGGA